MELNPADRIPVVGPLQLSQLADLNRKNRELEGRVLTMRHALADAAARDRATNRPAPVPRPRVTVPDDVLRRYIERSERAGRTKREFVVVYRYRPSPPVVRRLAH